MKRKYIIIASSLCAILLALIVACNVIIVSVSCGKCYDRIDSIPHSTYGILLGTGRKSTPSPYYDARVQGAIDLYKAGKIDYVVISGKNLYPDYQEVDSMVAAMEQAGVPIAIIDFNGTNTYTSLNSFGDVFGYRDRLTIISQSFHNQRAVFYGALLFQEIPIAYNVQDTNIWYWNVWRYIRESLARTKAVLFIPYYVFLQ